VSYDEESLPVNGLVGPRLDVCATGHAGPNDTRHYRDDG